MKIKPDIHVMKVTPSTSFDLDQQIMDDVYSFGFKNDHIGGLAQFSLGSPSDIDEGLDQWGYPEP